MKQTLHYFILLLSVTVGAQKIDTSPAFRDQNSDHYFRFHYDNDYFASSDHNYTQGFDLEFVAAFLKYNPMNVILVKPSGSRIRYGLSLEHMGYAPDNIRSAEIQFGDRPFAAAVVLKSFVVAIDTLRRSRLQTGLSIGVIGPAAFGRQMQEGIHSATGNTKPMGWKNQVRNDIIVQYETGYEKQFLHYARLFSLQGNATVRAGTLFTNASVGLSLMAGIVDSPFIRHRNGFRLYAYVQPLVTAVGYDATLQGGLINRDSPYTISDGDLERVTAQHTYGLVLQTKTLYFEYTRTALTREFNGGVPAKWGGIRIGFTF
ncbi:MAG: hypothetical protein CFE23_09655 [Flavobacterium sp. BFFFF1]|uniref:lipid A deacylase LpxR family protein n=1 Tax=Flavobacterium sp. BFFFF1 TaxID=2015557 RepID=UPI000BCAFE11|nr:lipid A deacylase LpxR family protein [Flavobacterium sp. BFFFF1]OYU80322.1 MAG: hypothetical protein CFE23_09655 [Flavobacterium sp. BFFFF1]